MVIVNSICGVKGQGVIFYGSMVIVVFDKYGNFYLVGFLRLVDVFIYVKIIIEFFMGYIFQVGEEIKVVVFVYINLLVIGVSVFFSCVYLLVNFGVVSGGNVRYYDIIELLIGMFVGGVVVVNVDIVFDQLVFCVVSNINLVVL